MANGAKNNAANQNKAGFCFQRSAQAAIKVEITMVITIRRMLDIGWNSVATVLIFVPTMEDFRLKSMKKIS